MNKETHLTKLQELELPVIFGEMQNGNFPKYFYFASTPLDYFAVSNGVDEIVSDLKELIPLWVDNGDCVVGYSPSRKEFIKFYYEDGGQENPNERISSLGKNYQQFLTSLLLEFYEADEIAHIDKFSELFQYQHLDELKNIMGTDPSEEDLEEFIGSL